MRQYKIWQQRAGFIARVIRCGTQHVCGICRSRSLDRWQAESCLESCWEELLSLDPVIRQSTHAAPIFKCRYCARRHDQLKGAMNCATACRAHFLRKHTLERQILSELADMPIPAKHKSKPTTKRHPSSTSFIIASKSQPLRIAGAEPSPEDSDSDYFTEAKKSKEAEPLNKIATNEHAQAAASNIEEWAETETDAEHELEEIVDAI